MTPGLSAHTQNPVTDGSDGATTLQTWDGNYYVRNLLRGDIEHEELCLLWRCTLSARVGHGSARINDQLPVTCRSQACAVLHKERLPQTCRLAIFGVPPDQPASHVQALCVSTDVDAPVGADCAGPGVMGLHQIAEPVTLSRIAVH